MAKKSHGCGFCGEEFPTVTEHLIHITLACGEEARRDGRKSLRFMNCWICHKQVSKAVMRCDCGWEYTANA
jgi:hypothetical protein